MKKLQKSKNIIEMERAHKTCLEMLRQRKYIIIEETDVQILARKPDGVLMVVFFTDVPKFNVKSIQIFIATMNQMNVFHAIIVYKDGVTAFTRKTIDQSLEMRFELFAEQDLQYNITKHKLQPKFERLTADENEQFKEKYGSKFGTMCAHDPIVRFYNYCKGDVIRIIRGDTDKFVTYRIVQ